MKYWMKYKYKNGQGNWLDGDYFSYDITSLVQYKIHLIDKYGMTNVIIENIVKL